jgi:two-component system response regulator AtoC
MELMERNRFDLIIADIVMPGRHNGLDVLSASRKADTEYKVIVITGFHTDETVERAEALGAADYMLKPFDVDSLRFNVREALNKGLGGGSLSGLAVYIAN